MNRITDKSECCGCHACYNICPTNAITMKEDEKGFKYPEIVEDKCIKCGACKKVCPVQSKERHDGEVRAFACYNKNDAERLKSSSGGIFVLLAKEILKKGGIVFGASLNLDLKVVHIGIENEEQLIKLMGSKYVQSDIGNTYKQAKEYLEHGRYVLFSGTPCQIGGLKSYLGREYDKLYCQDLICHGVPSPKVWEKYKEYREKKDNSVLANVSFRNKDEGWERLCLKFEYKNKAYRKDLTEDIFLQLFLKNIILRESCYNCSFKGKNRISDITLADYWGIQNIHADMSDNRGVSLAICHSGKGKELFDNIKYKLVYKETNLDKAIKYNLNMIYSEKMNSKREEFFEKLDKDDFEKLSQDAINFGEKIGQTKYLDVELIREVYNKLDDDNFRKVFINNLMWDITSDKEYIRNILNIIINNENIKIDNHKNMIIFGAGNIGKRIYGMFDNVNWECFVDNLLDGNTVNGLNVISPNELKKKYLDPFIIITPKQGNNEVYNQLLDLGVKKESIFNLGKYILELDCQKIKDIETSDQYIEPNANIGKEGVLLAGNSDLAKTKLAISLKNKDLLRVAELLLKCNSQYKFLLRYYSLENDDIIMYAFSRDI